MIDWIDIVGVVLMVHFLIGKDSNSIKTEAMVEKFARKIRPVENEYLFSYDEDAFAEKLFHLPT